MDQLTRLEKSRLSECEAVIKKSMNSFYDMGEALKEIRESRLYKNEFSSFEDYCSAKWAMKRDYADRVINSAITIDNLTPMGVVPDSERQTRPLTKLKDPQIQQQAWAQVVKESEETHEPITAKKVEAVVKQYCEPCENAMEFRLVGYLNPFNHNRWKGYLRGSKESEFIRDLATKSMDTGFINTKNPIVCELPDSYQKKWIDYCNSRDSFAVATEIIKKHLDSLAA